jgi:predicted metal-binding membrane protein
MMLPAVQPWSRPAQGIIALLAVAVVLSWAALARHLLAPMPDGMGSMGASQPLGGIAFIPMWSVMMVAMMFPTAAPMIALYARTRPDGVSAFAHTGTFVLGYIVLWVVFGVGAYALAVGADMTLDAWAPARTWVRFAPPVALIAAGAYQWTPLKRLCLSHCQNPLTFLLHRWRSGTIGSFRTGVSHGTYCIGCCWGEMAVLFVVGVMSLPWMALLTLFIFLEKVTRPGILLARAAGVGAAAYGLLLLVQAI